MKKEYKLDMMICYINHILKGKNGEDITEHIGDLFYRVHEGDWYKAPVILDTNQFSNYYVWADVTKYLDISVVGLTTVHSNDVLNKRKVVDRTGREILNAYSSDDMAILNRIEKELNEWIIGSIIFPLKDISGNTKDREHNKASELEKQINQTLCEKNMVLNKNSANYK